MVFLNWALQSSQFGFRSPTLYVAIEITEVKHGLWKIPAYVENHRTPQRWGRKGAHALVPPSPFAAG